MIIHVISVGHKMPDWIVQGYENYARRLKSEVRLQLHEISPLRRGHQLSVIQSVEQEGKKIRAAIPKQAHIVAMDVAGTAWSTEQLCQRLQQWLALGQDICLLIGGADGLDVICKQQAQEMWSLSPLTLPHALVRVVVAEQIYRAWSMLHQHPYHRS